ncbi:MAG: zinc ribbon-containing protein [Proteobacteria bacterium]|nr:zinc ribbon-containing protein [Pseudomonadota bacterium]MBU1717361.1 zinc ribbon-containing protein [Pseudomonadota bacterium]
MDKEKPENLKKQLEDQYDKFAAKTQEIYKSGRDKTKEALEKAIETAKEQLTESGAFSSEQGEKFKQYLKRDLAQTSEQLQQLGGEAKEYLKSDRLRTGALSSLSAILNKAEAGLKFLRKKTDAFLIYKTGEITTAGPLTCVECNKTINLKKTGHIPPCPSCSKTKFRKG